jgi:hypothetical protein
MSHLRMSQVNREIQKKYPLIKLVKGKGYHYIASDDPEMGVKVAMLYTTIIGVPFLNQQSLDAWIHSVERVLRDSDRLPVSNRKSII